MKTTASAHEGVTAMGIFFPLETTRRLDKICETTVFRY